jgi:hypothetical protein
MGIAAPEDFYENDRFLTVPSVAHIWLTSLAVFILLT